MTALKHSSKGIGRKPVAGAAKVGRVNPGRHTGVSSTAGRMAAKAAAPGALLYVSSKGIDSFVDEVRVADPFKQIEAERSGVDSVFVRDVAQRLNLPATRVMSMLGLPKATVAKKSAEGAMLTGNGGRAALAMARLLGIAQDIVESSTAAGAKDFDSARWLGLWLERPQAALGGRKPAELVDTPTGVEVVARLLSSIESGAYQ